MIDLRTLDLLLATSSMLGFSKAHQSLATFACRSRAIAAESIKTQRARWNLLVYVGHILPVATIRDGHRFAISLIPGTRTASLSSSIWSSQIASESDLCIWDLAFQTSKGQHQQEARTSSDEVNAHSCTSIKTPGKSTLRRFC